MSQSPEKPDTITDVEFYRRLLEPTTEEVDTTEEINFGGITIAPYPILKLSNLHVVNGHKNKEAWNQLELFRNSPRTIDYNIEIKKVSFWNKFHAIKIDSITFDNKLEIDLENFNVEIKNCTFNSGFFISNEGSSSITIENCQALNGRFWFRQLNMEKDFFGKKGETILKNSMFNLNGIMTIDVEGEIRIENSKFTTTAPSQITDTIWLEINGEMQRMFILNNDFQVPLNLSGSAKVERLIEFSENKIAFLSLNKFGFPEDPFNIYFKWNQIGNKYGIAREYNVPSILGMGVFKIKSKFLTLESDTSIISEKLFDEITSDVYHLYSIYKIQGDKASANSCYAEIKKFETRRWKYLYEQNKTFESFFRWQLNSFLSYFTDYGTNPAKAVIKSGWVILLFAIFYLFFPSDWDVSNRSQLLSKVKDLTSKNREKTFIATLAFVAYSAFIHILNALTLSLNAFTTLGFGDIPTHGAARYVTIVQGFIGWFLLTIFSVSLINQVLG